LLSSGLNFGILVSEKKLEGTWAADLNFTGSLGLGNSSGSILSLGFVLLLIMLAPLSSK